MAGYGETPFDTVLQNGSRFVVTGDSASMLAEACRTGAPVWLFALPGRPNFSDFMQHASDRCLGSKFRHRLVRLGWVGGGTDFRRWHLDLERRGYISVVRRVVDETLRQSPAHSRPDTDLRECRARILGMLETREALLF